MRLPVLMFSLALLSAGAQLSLCAQSPAAAARIEKYKQGHSHLGEGFDEGPRQKPWEIPGAGSAPFPITHKNPEVQKWFNQGNALLHSFWYYEAERAFRWCLKLEPENAMAYWGLSRSQGEGNDRAKQFLREAVKRKASVTERERLYIEAGEADLLPPTGEAPDNQRGTRILERIAMRYPDDLEAKALLALRGMMDNRYGTEEILREILTKAPNHPGAHHYRIHNWDGTDPEFALESCRRYGAIAPAVGHAQHMPGHVYAAAGMWHEAAISMDAATRVEKQYMIDRLSLPFESWNYPHNKNYLAYIQAQLGMEKAALSAGRQLMQAPREPRFDSPKSPYPQHMQAQIILARTFVRFGRWEELLKAEQFQWDDQRLGNKAAKLHVEGLAHLALGNPDQARKRLHSLEELKEEVEKSEQSFLKPQYPVMVKELKAKILLAEDRVLEGLTALSEAALEFVKLSEQQNDPPFFPSNVLDDLGRAYLTAKSPALAVKAYERSLEIVRNDAWALAGLAEAHLALKEQAKAEEYYGRLLYVWSDADAPMPVMQTGINAKPVDRSPAPQRNYARTTLRELGPDRWEPFAAPKLEAVDSLGKRISLSDYKGKNVLLIFYLGRECPHCMEQLQEAAKRKADLESRNTVVLAISGKTAAENTDAQQLAPMPFPLLADEGLANAKRFLSYDDFEEMELHSTLLIDGSGRVRWGRYGGDPFMDFDFLLRELDRIRHE